MPTHLKTEERTGKLRINAKREYIEQREGGERDLPFTRKWPLEAECI